MVRQEAGFRGAERWDYRGIPYECYVSGVQTTTQLSEGKVLTSDAGAANLITTLTMYHRYTAQPYLI